MLIWSLRQKYIRHDFDFDFDSVGDGGGGGRRRHRGVDGGDGFGGDSGSGGGGCGVGAGGKKQAEYIVCAPKLAKLGSIPILHYIAWARIVKWAIIML